MKKCILLTVLFIGIAIYGNAQTLWVNKTMLKGTVGKYPIVMVLAIPYGGATSCFAIGEYYYTSTKSKIFLCSTDDGRLIESVKEKETGFFRFDGWNDSYYAELIGMTNGWPIGRPITGRWYSMDYKRSYPFTLKIVSRDNR